MKDVYPEKPIEVPEQKKPKNRLSILSFVMGALIYYFLIKPFFN